MAETPLQSLFWATRTTQTIGQIYFRLAGTRPQNVRQLQRWRLGIGEIKVFDYAFVTSYDSTATAFAIVDTLKRDADIIQQFFNNSIVPCRATHVIPLGLDDAGRETLHVSVYPDPSSSLLFIETESNMDVAELTDMLGIKLNHQNCRCQKTFA